MKFLAVTDLHYADRALGEGDRHHSQSLERLKEALKYCDDCDFIINLGDTADSFSDSRDQRTLLSEVKAVLDASGKPYYNIIGNHDTSIVKTEFYTLFDMKNRYYAFDTTEYRVIVLDACLNDVNDPIPKEEIIWDDCYIDGEQKNWLVTQLRDSDKKVIVFTHVPFMLSERETDDPHLIKNRYEIMDVFEKSGKVSAVFSGHYHSGTYGKSGGIHYVTFASMCVGDKNSFAVVEAGENSIVINGYGNIPSYTL